MVSIITRIKKLLHGISNQDYRMPQIEKILNYHFFNFSLGSQPRSERRVRREKWFLGAETNTYQNV